MALLTATFETELQALVDDPPTVEDEAIQRHASAFRAYFEGVMGTTLTAPVPLILPPGHDAGQAAFQTAAIGQSLSIALVVAAYTAYVTAAVTVPNPAFVLVTPPPTPLVLTPAPIASYVQTVDLWLRTGTSTFPGTPPVVSPWL